MRIDELQDCRNRLTDLRDRSSQQLEHMVEGVCQGDRAPGEHDAFPSESAERAIILELGEEELHRRILEALERIDSGLYGICLRCGDKIPKKRLRAIPYAERCVACEQQFEQSQ